MNKGIPWIRVFVVIILLVVTIILLVTAFVNIIDYKTNFLNLNPPVTYSKSIILRYPDIGPEYFVIVNSSQAIENPAEPILLTFNITLQHQGILAENTNVDVIANGVIHSDVDQIKYVTVGFEDAEPFNGEILMPEPSHIANYTSSIPLIFDPTLTQHYPDTILETISWNTQGDYLPFVTIYYANKSQITTEYTKQKIHIAGSDIVEQEKYSRINTWIAIALLIFTTVMLWQSIIQLLKEKSLSCIIFGSEETDRKDESTRKHQKHPKSQK